MPPGFAARAAFSLAASLCSADLRAGAKGQILLRHHLPKSCIGLTDYLFLTEVAISQPTSQRAARGDFSSQKLSPAYGGLYLHVAASRQWKKTWIRLPQRTRTTKTSIVPWNLAKNTPAYGRKPGRGKKIKLEKKRKRKENEKETEHHTRETTDNLPMAPCYSFVHSTGGLDTDTGIGVITWRELEVGLGGDLMLTLLCRFFSRLFHGWVGWRWCWLERQEWR